MELRPREVECEQHKISQEKQNRSAGGLVSWHWITLKSLRGASEQMWHFNRILKEEGWVECGEDHEMELTGEDVEQD